MDGRVTKGQETKEKIILATLRLISEGGIAGISAKKIADAAGVSKSNIFHHFTSVELLLESILGSLCTEAVKDLNIDECEDLQSFLLILGKGTFTLTGEDLAIYRTLFVFYHEAVFKDRYKEQIKAAKNGIVDYIVDTFRRITGKKVDRDIAEMIAMDLDGMGMHYMVEGNSEKYLNMWHQKVTYYVQWIESL